MSRWFGRVLLVIVVIIVIMTTIGCGSRADLDGLRDGLGNAASLITGARL